MPAALPVVRLTATFNLLPFLMTWPLTLLMTCRDRIGAMDSNSFESITALCQARA